jgi:glycosyltransferase involved in cell wall biosynthesis
MDDKMLRETLVRKGFETAGRYPQEREWDELENLLYSYYYEVVKPRSVVKGLTSVVVVLNSDQERTKECLQSIEKFTANPHEVVLVPCNCEANTVKDIRKLIKGKQNYKLIERDKGADETKRRNQGIEASSGEYILLLGNDVVVTENWLSGMLECLNSAPDMGIVGPMTNNNNISGNQRVEDAGYQSIADLNVFAQSFRERNRHRRVPSRRIVGFCMLFRRKLVEKIGLLDETFGTGNFEDDDFCLRTALEGYGNFIAGDVFIHHYGSRSFRGNRTEYGSAMTGNRKIFREKWSGIDRESSLGEKVLVLSALEDADSRNQKGNVDMAVEALLEGIRRAPTEKRLYYALSEILIDAKQFKEAYGVIKEMSFDENDLRRLELIGYCAEGIECYDEADRYADRALSLNPASAPALNLKGILAHKKGDNEKAQELFQEAIKADPGFGEPYTNIGVLKWASGHREEALSLLEKGCTLSPTIGDIATSYHSAISALACFERAERVFWEAQALYPLNRRIAFLLIDTLIQQGKNDIAIKEIEKAMIAFGIDDGILSAALKIRETLGPRKIDGKCSRSTLSLCMIVKNEEAYIAQCLSSVDPVVDEMIIVDTGSTDRTRDIARVFGAQVHDFQWTHNFAEARNFSLTHAHGDWILVLDADEIISSKDRAALTDLIKKQKRLGYSFITRNYTGNVNTEGWVANNGEYLNEEAADGWFPSQKVRLFPRDPSIQFENHVHELVEPSLRKGKIEIEKCRIPVHHYGRLDRKRDTVKEEAYYELGKVKLQGKGDDVKALSELAVTAGTVGKYEEAIELWQRVIAIKPDFVKAFVNLGYVYLQLQRYENALAVSKRAVELAPDQKETILNYASAEVHAGDVKKAISLLEHLLNKIPEFPPAIGVLAAAYCIQGEREKGLAYIEKVKKLGFNCPEFLYKHARSLKSAGRNHFAMRLLEAAVESNQVNDDITLLRSELQSESGCETIA